MGELRKEIRGDVQCVVLSPMISNIFSGGVFRSRARIAKVSAVGPAPTIADSDSFLSSSDITPPFYQRVSVGTFEGKSAKV